MPHRFFVGQISSLSLSFSDAWIKAAIDAQQECKNLVVFKIPAAAEATIVKEVEKLLERLTTSAE